MPSIGIADCNNFYVSCERVFRPRLDTQPVIIVGNNDGCVIARSNDIKPIIPMGAPLHTLRHLITQQRIQVFSANFALYGDLSQRVMQELAAFAPMQIYSIDEAFLELSRVPPTEQNAYARTIRATVQHNTGIPISIGIAPTKTLAKLANTRAKKHEQGVFFLQSPEAIDQLLQMSKVEDIWGISTRRGAWLRQHGIETAYALQQADLGWIKRHLSVVMARTVLELRGISCLPLEEVREPKQEICTSRAFRQALRDITSLREAVATYTTRGAEKLRSQNSLAGSLTVFIHTNPFSTDDTASYAAHAVVPLIPTANTQELIAAAFRGLAACYKPGYLYHKAGVILTQFTPDHLVQGTLFESQHPQAEQLQVIIDSINAKWGRDTIHYAASGLKRPWAMQQSNRSQRYTSHWDELLTTE